MKPSLAHVSLSASWYILLLRSSNDLPHFLKTFVAQELCPAYQSSLIFLLSASTHQEIAQNILEKADSSCISQNIILNIKMECNITVVMWHVEHIYVFIDLLTIRQA